MTSAPAWLRHGRPRPFLPVHLLAGFIAFGVLAGVLLGAVRGSGYLPTLPFALVEGGILVGVPTAVVGGLAAGAWCLARRLRSSRP